MNIARFVVDSIGGPTILIFIGGIIAAIGAVWAAYDQNQASTKLDQKNEEIARLNRETANAVTGGDSYCYALPFGNHAGSFTIVHEGNFPLYDVAVRFVDLDDFEAKPPTFSTIGKNTYQIGNLAPHAGQLFGPLEGFNAGDHKRLNLFFSARNGFVTQELGMHRVKGYFQFATRVTRQLADGNAETLYTKISDDYPREPDGSVDWK